MTNSAPTRLGDMLRLLPLSCVVVGVVWLAGAAGSEAADEAAKNEMEAVEKAVEQYVCVAETAAGFSYREGSGWRAGALKTDSKYLVARTKRGEVKLGWKVTGFGSTSTEFGFCEQQFLGIRSANPVPEDLGPMVACGHTTPFSVFGTFEFNQRTKRFMRFYPGLYLNGDDRPGADTPYLEAGTCAALLEGR